VLPGAERALEALNGPLAALAAPDLLEAQVGLREA